MTPTRRGVSPARRPLMGSDDLTKDNDAVHARDNGAALLKRSPRLGRWRRLAGLVLLGFVVFLWTASNFLASNLLADRSYNKPFMVTYLNSSSFVIPLIPILVMKAYQHPEDLRDWRKHWRKRLFRRKSRHVKPSAETYPYYEESSTSSRLSSSSSSSGALFIGTTGPTPAPHFPHLRHQATSHDHLSLPDTARVSLEFCLIWFLANFFVTACLEYTTVASSTILTSTSSIFTLAIGWYVGVERFTLNKALGVLASFAGVALIASMDASGSNTDADHRGDFPAKSRGEAILGDAIALASAAMYGVYSVLMKKRLGDEGRVNMPLFFGFVGLFIVLLAWPGFLVLHFAGIEPFALPPNPHVTAVLLLNSLASLLSDIAWAFAVLLTSPIVVSVGLSLTIPLSLVGQVVISRQTTPPWYWFGALVVVVSFVFVNNEEKRDEAARERELLRAQGLETASEESSGEVDRLLA